MHHDSPRIQQEGRKIQIESKAGGLKRKPFKGKAEAGGKKIEIKEGQTFGRLTAICFLKNDRHHHSVWLFSCSCGAKKEITAIYAYKGLTRSCGCLRKETTTKLKTIHGLKNNNAYEIWCGIKKRCFNKKCKEYPLYGARGITVHPEWVASFKSFYDHVGPRPSKSHSIDRINNDGNYEPGNVRWATSIEQANNKRNNSILTVFGKKKTIAEWERDIGCSKELIRQRIKKLGWSAEKAILTPKRHVNY